jgi:uncharacterized protein YigA (DUF484 family)
VSLPELIDKIDSLLSGGANVSVVRSQLVVLREQSEALEQRLSTLETNPQSDALAKECDRLRALLSEAHETIERLRYDVSQSKQSHGDRPDLEHRILLFLTQHSRADERGLSQELGAALELIRFHLQELEKDELIYGSHFYTGKPSEWRLGQEGRRYLNERNLLG